MIISIENENNNVLSEELIDLFKTHILEKGYNYTIQDCNGISFKNIVNNFVMKIVGNEEYIFLTQFPKFNYEEINTGSDNDSNIWFNHLVKLAYLNNKIVILEYLHEHNVSTQLDRLSHLRLCNLGNNNFHIMKHITGDVGDVVGIDNLKNKLNYYFNKNILIIDNL